MGKNAKPFIDRKKAVTYNLVYRNAEDIHTEEDAKDRILYPQSASQPLQAQRPPRAPGAAGGDFGSDDDYDEAEYFDGDEEDWEAEFSHGPQDRLEDEDWESKRREMIDLGFPDDGYDYLKHLRAPGRAAAAALEARAAGPSASAPGPSAPPGAEEEGDEGEGEEAEEQTVTIDAEVPLEDDEASLPLPPDVRVFDARQLRVEGPARDETDAEGRLMGVSAFARPFGDASSDLRRRHRALREVEEAMRALEGEEEGEGEEGEEEEGTLDDMFDNFVMEATKENEERMRRLAEAYERRRQGAAESDGSEDEEGEEEEEEDEGEEVIDRIMRQKAATSGMSRAIVRDDDGRSVASQWRRAERVDRTDAQTVIDEQFERLAIEYDDDEIGDLEDESDKTRGRMSAQILDKVVDDFMKKYPKPAAPAAPSVRGEEEEAGGSGEEGAPSGPALGRRIVRPALNGEWEDEDEDARTAREVARRLAKGAALKAIPEGAALERGMMVEEEETEIVVVEKEVEKWDCETVLSLRSNLENHPGRISEPSSGRKKRGGAAASDSGAADGVLVGLAAAGFIKLSAKTGMPVGYTGPAKKGEEGEGEDGEDSEGSEGAGGAHQPRRKGETAEEKRARKGAVKDARRQARETKKVVKGVYKEEAARIKGAKPQASTIQL